MFIPTPPHVYTLYRLVTDQDHDTYIGITRNPKQRLHDHHSRRDHPAKHHWLTQARAQGQRSHLITISTHPDKASALQAETALIHFLHTQPVRLHNRATTTSDAPRARTPEGRARTGQANRDRLARRWTLTDPHGQEHHITNLKAFAQAHALDPSTLSRVAKGHQAHHKGWTCQAHPDPAPDNECPAP